MRLVVLDTNVIVSASISSVGPPAKIITDWVLSGMVHTVTSPLVVAKYREVIRRAKFLRYKFPPLWLEDLIEDSIRLPDPDSWPFACPDSQDAPFLALAHAAGAWLVTGNLKHFPESVRNEVKVLSPADYLAHLVGNEQVSK
jgi:putative PIN family toxin of toxin-antitoxin system